MNFLSDKLSKVVFNEDAYPAALFFAGFPNSFTKSSYKR
jgi:hypothetical protein